jgi:DNA-binding MarR family transcriptional regulator
MKVSDLLNDVAANMGVTPQVLLNLTAKGDEEFREMVKEILKVLPKEDLHQIADNPGLHPQLQQFVQTLLKEP